MACHHPQYTSSQTLHDQPQMDALHCIAYELDTQHNSMHTLQLAWKTDHKRLQASPIFALPRFLTSS
jgi:hypothetical protein